MEQGNEKAREDRLRREARKHGLVLRKGRGRQNMDNRGLYQILDAARNMIEAGEKFDMSLDAVEAFLKSK